MDLVEHKEYGKGEVEKTRFSGFELLVRFINGIKRWVRRDDLRVLSRKPVIKPQKPPGPTLSAEQLKARQIIEALRVGIVPYQHVYEFTFGREYEIEQIRAWLNDELHGCMVIVGEYGVGKSHLLEYLYFMALNEGWAVSLVELDPNEAPFHKPKSIYQLITSSFKFRDRNGNFRTFLKEVAKSEKAHMLKTHKYFSSVVEKIRQGNDDEAMWNWIEGIPSGSYYYPPLYPYSTCANIYCYILSAVGWAARNILGLKGFLVLFDEAESVEPYWYTSYQNEKGWNFLAGLILMTNNDSKLVDDVNHLERRTRYSYGGSSGYWGKYTNLQYCGRLHLPFLWKLPTHVKVVFAFAPVSYILEEEPLNQARQLKLGHIDDQSLHQLAEKILETYSMAYGYSPQTNPSKYVPRDKTRLYLKGLVEALDLMRFHREKDIKSLLE